jgi:murein DD-endopeptidase MepM/ murein hydrolase activator NlpD
MHKLLLIIFLVSSLFSYEIINGKTFLLEVANGDKIFKDGKELNLLKHPIQKEKAFLLLPIGYKDKIQDIELLHVNEKIKEKVLLHVKKGDYKKETLKVNPKKVNPPKKELDRIYKEYMESKKIYAKNTKTRYWTKPFINPMNTKITSQYGNARIFNGSLKSYHSGTDFRAPTGTPIHSINDGVVVVAADRYYAGNAVVIDHGEGIYSSYSHLSKISVKVGQHVTQKEKLGLSGSTGRVTGPHLHFSIVYQSKRMNPLDFIEKINSLY